MNYDSLRLCDPVNRDSLSLCDPVNHDSVTPQKGSIMSRKVSCGELEEMKEAFNKVGEYNSVVLLPGKTH